MTDLISRLYRYGKELEVCNEAADEIERLTQALKKANDQAEHFERDSGGEHPWGEPVYVPCDCKDAEIGRQWRDNSSLEKWFPLTAERLARLEAENAALKHDLQYARDGLTKGRTRMREDNERLAREAHTWRKAAETYAAELHEGCRMPMEQARELAASEASPDWYARGQDWGLADALTNGQSGDWVLDDIARAFAAGAAAKTTMKVEISSDPEMVRRAMAAETEVALLRAAMNGGNVIERLQFALHRLADAADALGVNHFGDDWLSDEVQELQAATRAARLALGPNVGEPSLCTNPRGCACQVARP